MKISEMLKREDFYTMNKKTLNLYYGNIQDQKEKLYIYPYLNAIVCNNPSSHVIKYLLCEYNLNSNIIKKIIVKFYIIICMKTRGLFASENIVVSSLINRNTLIYPCNKKYRIFFFDKNEVEVINKVGFNNQNLLHEIEFRTRNDIPDFVPKIIKVTKYGYREKIIDGKPLARISNDQEEYKKRTFQLLQSYSKEFEYIIKGDEYVQILLRKINSYIKKENMLVYNFLDVIRILAQKANQIENITVTFSHGDLQSGNIWIENVTNKIYIIDWESWGKRSIWYDYVTLYYNMRNNLEFFLSSDFNENQKCLVLLEDIAYRLDDINQMPNQFENKQFEDYIKKIFKYL